MLAAGTADGPHETYAARDQVDRGFNPDVMTAKFYAPQQGVA